MKIIFTSLTIALCCIYGCSQPGMKVNVPDVVKNKFAIMYPNAGNTTWEMEDGKYETSFKEDKLETAAIFNPDGTLYQTENEMAVSGLPQSVRDYVAGNLGNKKITGATKIVSASGITTYETEVSKTDYVFDASGQYVGVENEEVSEEEDD